MRNNSLKNKEKNIASDDEEAPKDSESSSGKGKKPKEKVVAPIYGKNILPKEFINV